MEKKEEKCDFQNLGTSHSRGLFGAATRVLLPFVDC